MNKESKTLDFNLSLWNCSLIIKKMFVEIKKLYIYIYTLVVFGLLILPWKNMVFCLL